MKLPFVQLFVLAIMLCTLSVSASAQPSDKVVAVVNGVQLIEADLNQEIQKLMPNYRGVHGGMSQEKLDNVRNEAMKKLVDMELYYQDALAKGMKLSSDELKTEIANLAKRYKSKDDFDKIIANAGFSPDSFNRFVERNILSARIYKREIVDAVVVTEQIAKNYYDKNATRYSKPQEYRASHILLKVDPSASQDDRTAVKKRMEGILKKIKDGADFSIVASEESDDLTRIKGGDIGYFHEGQALPEFDEVLRTMKVGDVSGVLDTIYGYHIIKLTDKKPPRTVPFAEIKEKIKGDITEVERKQRLDAWLSGLMNKAKISYPK